jgi:hypothetical protein
LRHAVHFNANLMAANLHSGTPLSPLRAAGIGALVSALLGPCVGAFALLLSSFIRAAQVPSRADDLVGFVGWGLVLSIYGVCFMGIPALLFGALGGMFIQWRASAESRPRVNLEASIAGAALGAAVPATVILAGWGSKDVIAAFMVAGAVSGALCALVISAMLHRGLVVEKRPESVS